MLSMLDPANVSNTSLRKVAFTRWNVATSHKAWISNCKLAFRFFSYRLQLHTATDMCSQLYRLLIDVFVCLEACCHVTSMNANCHWYWAIIGRNQYRNLISTDCCTSLHNVTVEQIHLRCTFTSLFDIHEVQINNWYGDEFRVH
jgi:hypothetical protein